MTLKFLVTVKKEFQARNENFFLVFLNAGVIRDGTDIKVASA